MGRKKKWETKSHNVMATELRKEINPQTEKPWTDVEIMQKFGYFSPGGFKNPIPDNARDNANNANTSAEIPSTSTLINRVEMTTDDIIAEAKRMHENEDSVASLKVLVDIWRVKQNVVDETDFDEEMDLSELIEIATSHNKSKEAGNELDKDTVSD